VPPPAWEGDADSWHAWLAEQLAHGEDEIRRNRRKPFLGRARVLSQHPFDRPRNPEQLAPTRNPVIKTGGDGGLMRFAIAALRAWRSAYYEALERWRVDKSVCFPFGTWWVVQRAGAGIA
jgi:hypothetical protein